MPHDILRDRCCGRGDLKRKKMKKDIKPDIPQFILDCPVVFEWCKYKGDVVFASLNYEKSVEEGRCWIDLHYCATKALNNIVEKTVLYRKSDFEVHDWNSKEEKRERQFRSFYRSNTY
jgi:hypothetical protein